MKKQKTLAVLLAGLITLSLAGCGADKPYKYSFAGQQTVAADAAELTITNPTAFESKPYIKLYGSGTMALLIQPQGRGMMISDLDGTSRSTVS